MSPASPSRVRDAGGRGTTPTRAYRACLPCRHRKAKCDLGDVNHPKDPPCSACVRRKIDCAFAPSQRRGRRPARESSRPNRHSGLCPTNTTPFALDIDLGLDVSIDAEGSHSLPDTGSQTRHVTLHDSGAPEDRDHAAHQSILAGSRVRNPVDAVELLLKAAQADGRSSPPQGHSRTTSTAPHTAGQDELDQYVPIRRGLLTAIQLQELVGFFFEKLHGFFPMIPYNRIPRDGREIGRFAGDECHLLTAMLVIAAKHKGMFAVSTEVWKYMQEEISRIYNGAACSTGTVEALLLLSEFLPLQQDDLPPMELNAVEDRLTWINVGLAIRIGYLLGLDQQTASSPLVGRDLNNATLAEQGALLNDRNRIAWTYCYLFDRQSSLRTGRASWARGPKYALTSPNLLFADYFPSLRPIPGVQDDYASYLNCFLELTHLMSSVQDVLFSSKEHIQSITKDGEYHKYLDEIKSTLTNFRRTWQRQQWATYPCNECVWMSFHYLRLYVHAFAFEAHLQRAAPDALARLGSRSSDQVENALFPKGIMGSADARFIFEAVNSAGDLIRLGVDQLHPGGAMQYLPYRYYLYLTQVYAAVFLLKVAILAPMSSSNTQNTINLLKRLVHCFRNAAIAGGEQHHGFRFAGLIKTLLDKFAPRLGVDTLPATRQGSPRPSVPPATSANTDMTVAPATLFAPVSNASDWWTHDAPMFTAPDLPPLPDLTGDPMMPNWTDDDGELVQLLQGHAPDFWKNIFQGS